LFFYPMREVVEASDEANSRRCHHGREGIMSLQETTAIAGDKERTELESKYFRM
jgi:hypothetical protein